MLDRGIALHRNVDRKHVEADLRDKIEELGKKLVEKDSDEEKLGANLRGHIKDLEKKLQEREQLETALHSGN
jgi:septal ring factor EnvC (AmiA/AmiB activator)